MKIKTVFRVLALICLVVSFAMIPSGCIALYDRSRDARAFLFSILTGIFTSVILSIMSDSKDSHSAIGIREGVGITGFSWAAASFIGALPYWLSGCVPSYTDAFFETMSGFTTTGATIFSKIEALPRGILLWRSLTHWMGGMG
ncbi:MAG: TrkH family potassium uptake protein, partial [Synergistaceae bacterium]|nr:TrkH family potassium uptake protein [Synergistaceae bacterium]